MKYIKQFEIHNPNYGSDWKIGDIIVSTITKYASDSKWLHEDYKYEIIEFAHVNTTVKVKEVGRPYENHEWHRRPNVPSGRPYTDYDRPGVILNAYFFKDNFITLEEWELRNSANKYNL